MVGYNGVVISNAESFVEPELVAANMAIEFAMTLARRFRSKRRRIDFVVFLERKMSKAPSASVKEERRIKKNK